MDLKLIASLAGLLAIFVSTGIISVGFTTLLTNMGIKLFSREPSKETGIPIFVYRGDLADSLRDDLQMFPDYFRKVYITCHSFWVLMILVVCLKPGITPIVSESRIHFVGATEFLNGYSEFFIGVMGFLLVIYIVFIIRQLLKINEKFYAIIGARIHES